ncbi:MAG: STAS domain-containing protein [Anaerolineae bacterium]|nr:STAS domain-containing protein [Anaerolineales bacterium]MCQ3971984.1 anti-sigma factor antagonist [Anaerolineae bacterium]
MEVTTKELRRCDLVIAKGRIDTATVKTLSQALAEIKEAGRYKIVLNMKDVTYISSAGLSELIDTQNTCKYLKRGELVLAEVPPRIREVFELAGLTPLFKMYDTEIEAVGNF